MEIGHRSQGLQRVYPFPYGKTFVQVGVAIFFPSGKVENNVGKGENADYKHFLLFQQSFE